MATYHMHKSNTFLRLHYLQSKIVCKFMKVGKCKHGLSGRKFEEQSCSFNHPEVCKENRLYGKCPDDEWGECTKIHLHICYEYRDTLSCKFGKDNCKFWHPPGLKNYHSRQDNQRKFLNSRVFHGKNQPYSSQGDQIQHSFLEPSKLIQQKA